MRVCLADGVLTSVLLPAGAMFLFPGTSLAIQVAETVVYHKVISLY